MVKKIHSRIRFRRSQLGFTIAELLVVISIMGIMLSLILVNFGTERTARSLRIAQNDLVTNLRRVQSNSLSSRSFDGVHQAQYYLLKLDATGNRDTYQVQAIYDYYTNQPKVATIDTVKLPQGIRFAPVGGPVTNGAAGLLLNRPVVPTMKQSSCVLVAFKVPFGDIYMNDGCSFNNFNNDDYKKIINFVINTDYASTTTDTNLTVRFQDDKSGDNTHTVVVRGATGKITAQ